MAGPTEPLIVSLRNAVEIAAAEPSDFDPPMVLVQSVEFMLVERASFGPSEWIAERALVQLATTVARTLLHTEDDALMSAWEALVFRALAVSREELDLGDARIRSFVRTTGMIFGIDDELVPGALAVFDELAKDDCWSLLHTMAEAPMYEHWAPWLERWAPHARDDGSLRALRRLIQSSIPIDGRRRRARPDRTRK